MSEPGFTAYTAVISPPVPDDDCWFLQVIENTHTVGAEPGEYVQQIRGHAEGHLDPDVRFRDDAERAAGAVLKEAGWVQVSAWQPGWVEINGFQKGLSGSFEAIVIRPHQRPVPAWHYHDATGQENTPCLCDQPGTYARQAPNPLDPADAQPDDPCTEDGEQCLQCLRYTYDPHLDLCLHCRFQMHPEEED